MTTPLKVSICLPTCNRPELIVQCLDFCLAQTHTNIEIVIGDDSKDDRTHRLMAARYQHDPRIRYVKNEPSLGQASNVTSLFARACGDVILLIHDDDYLVEVCLARSRFTTCTNMCRITARRTYQSRRARAARRVPPRCPPLNPSPAWRSTVNWSPHARSRCGVWCRSSCRSTRRITRR
jgi:glycosyltransferase involved in cell wall biosynthesis